MWTYLKNVPKEETTSFLKTKVELERSSSKLCEVNAHERDKRITKDDVRHIYEVDGKEIPISGTGFKGFFFPKFDPEQRIRSMFSRSKIQGPRYQSQRGSEYDGLTALEIARRWENNRDRGTAIHAVIEKFYDFYHNVKPDEQLKANEIRVLLKMIAEESGFQMPDGMIFLIGGQLAAFQSVWSIYRVEWVIYDEELGVAGTIDAIFVRQTPQGCKYYIVDWKSRMNVNITQNEGNCFYPFEKLKASPISEYQVQLSLYADIVKRKYGLDVEGISAVAILNDAIRLINFNMLDMTKAYEIYKGDLMKEQILREGFDKISDFQYPEKKEPEFKSLYSIKEEEFLYDENERWMQSQASDSKRRKY